MVKTVIHAEFDPSEIEELYAHLAPGSTADRAAEFLATHAAARGLIPIEGPMRHSPRPDRPLPGTFWTMRAVTREAWDREVAGK
jgi:hypothetical protein